MEPLTQKPGNARRWIANALNAAIVTSAVVTVTAQHALAVDDFKPQYELTVSDASKLYRFSRENAWMNEFYQSNLYRGLSLRLAPALTLVADAKTDRWSGRLLDFLMEKIASNRPMTIAYFHESGLASPLGIRISGLNAAEESLLNPVINQLKVGKSYEANAGHGPVSITAVSAQSQIFAVAAKLGCVSISREPKVAAYLASTCPKSGTKPKNDAVLEIALKKIAPSMYPFATAFAGVTDSAKVRLTWDETGKRFTADRIQLGLSKDGHILRSSKLPEDLVKALPAQTLALASFVVPKPDNFSPEKMGEFLAAGPAVKKDGPGFVVTMAALSAGTSIETVVLLPEKNQVDERLEELASLFPENKRFTVGFRKVCGSLIALSPSTEALESIESACEGKRPALTNHPSPLKERLLKEAVSAGLFVNLADIMSEALMAGWRSENASKDLPREMQQAAQLLSKLPRFSFAGPAKNGMLEMTGVQQ